MHDSDASSVYRAISNLIRDIIRLKIREVLKMHIEKFSKSSFQGLLLHCDRTFKNHSNESIDITKSNLNYNVSENKKSAKEVLEFAQSHMRGGKKIRDNINVVVGACVTLPKGIDTNNKDERELFFQASYEFLKWRYCQGKEERIISSFVHLDETTPHMHFLFVPIDENNYLSAKNLITKKDLQSLHQDYSKTMTSIFQRDIEVMNGITKKRGNLEIDDLKQISEEKNKLASERNLLEREKDKLNELRNQTTPKRKVKDFPKPDNFITGTYNANTVKALYNAHTELIERYNGLIDQNDALKGLNGVLERSNDEITQIYAKTLLKDEKDRFWIFFNEVLKFGEDNIKAWNKFTLFMKAASQDLRLKAIDYLNTFKDRLVTNKNIREAIQEIYYKFFPEKKPSLANMLSKAREEMLQDEKTKVLRKPKNWDMER